MTAEEWETLKQKQKQALKGVNLAELNSINKMLFDERERRQKERARAREQEREKTPFCENLLFLRKNAFFGK